MSSPRSASLSVAAGLLWVAAACDSSTPPPPDAAVAKAQAATPAAAKPPAEAPAKPPAPPPEPAKELTKFPELGPDAVLIKPQMLAVQLRAPKGAKLGRNINGWQDITAGAGFGMVAREAYSDAIAKAKEELGDVKFVVDEKATLVYEKDGKFGFVQYVDAKGPEVLDGEADRQVECRAGAAMDWAVSKKPKLYTREQVDHMVASCRTAEIPPLKE